MLEPWSSVRYLYLSLATILDNTYTHKVVEGEVLWSTQLAIPFAITHHLGNTSFWYDDDASSAPHFESDGVSL